MAIFVSVECGVTKGMLYKKQRKYTKEQQSGGDVRNCDLLEILNIQRFREIQHFPYMVSLHKILDILLDFHSKPQN